LTWHQKCQSVNRQQIAFQGSDLLFFFNKNKKTKTVCCFIKDYFFGHVR
jgi:hypothetical protein